MNPRSPDPIRLMYIQPAEMFGGAERQGVILFGISHQERS